MTFGECITALAYLVGAAVFYLAARERGLSSQGMGKIAAIGLFFGILGAKVTQLISDGGSWNALFTPSTGGRALLGGLVFGWLAVEVAKFRMGIRSSTGPMFALALPAGEAVGRIGCYLNGCCFGSKWSGPWSVFQHDALRHPAQLYSAVYSLILFCVLIALRNRLRDEKNMFRLYLLGWAVGRLALEFVRDGRRQWLGLSFMQLFAIEIAMLAAIGIGLSYFRQPNRNMETL